MTSPGKRLLLHASRIIVPDRVESDKVTLLIRINEMNVKGSRM